MGAGQIGGIATLLDIDFHNAAGFLGKNAELMEAQFIVYFLSHTMMFCVGSLIEPHVILTPASCVYAERYKFDIYAGTHHFIEELGSPRTVIHMCVHRGYNSTERGLDCSSDNLALLVIAKPYFASEREPATEFVISRIRYGQYISQSNIDRKEVDCHFYGWGSRRNGYLIPLLIVLRRVDVTVIDSKECLQMWNWKDKFLCMNHFACRTDKYGALCPDDLGSVVVCHGFLRGMMVSRLIDRPCGVGFIDMAKYTKFLTCGVDDARDVLGHDDYMEFGYTTYKTANTPSVASIKENLTTVEMSAAPLTNPTEDGEGGGGDGGGDGGGGEGGGGEGPGEVTTYAYIHVTGQETNPVEAETATSVEPSINTDKSKRRRHHHKNKKKL